MRTWIESASVASHLHLNHVRLVNDVEAAAYGIGVLEPGELEQQLRDRQPDHGAVDGHLGSDLTHLPAQLQGPGRGLPDHL